MADKKYSVDDILRIFSKLDKKIEDLSCFVKECCAKIPVNIGTGIGLFKKFNQNKWEFKSLLPGNNISITQTNNEVIISSTTEPVDCQDIKDCLGISNLGDPDKYLNEQGTWQSINLTGTPLEVLYYDNLGNITSDNNFYRVTTGANPNTYIKSIDNNSGGYSEIYAGSNYLALYNDLSGSGDGGYLYLQNTAKLGKITAGNFSSYLEVDSTNFIYRNTSIGVTFVYPNVDGLNGHVLTTNGAGDLTFQPIPSTPQYITAIADTNTVDLTETAGTLTADVNYQNTATINLSEDASGLKADFASMNISQFTNDSNYVDGIGTANEIAYFVDSNTIDSLDTATYPSLTELSYVKGVTSAIQTQINNRALVLLSTATASNSSSIDFEVDYTIYKKYIIEFTDVQSSVNYTDDLWLRVGTGSPVAYKSGANDYSWARNGLSTATSVSSSNTSAGAYSDTKVALDPFLNNTGVYSVSGSVVIYSPSNSTYHKLIEWTSTMRWITSLSVIGTTKYSGSATYRAATAITGLRIMSSTGNILTGTFKLYGVA